MCFNCYCVDHISCNCPKPRANRYNSNYDGSNTSNWHWRGIKYWPFVRPSSNDRETRKKILPDARDGYWNWYNIIHESRHHRSPTLNYEVPEREERIYYNTYLDQQNRKGSYENSYERQNRIGRGKERKEKKKTMGSTQIEETTGADRENKTIQKVTSKSGKISQKLISSTI